MASLGVMAKHDKAINKEMLGYALKSYFNKKFISSQWKPLKKYSRVKRFEKLIKALSRQIIVLTKAMVK